MCMKPAALALHLPLCAGFLLVACKLNVGPTAPQGQVASLSTSHGVITVYSNDHLFDASSALAAIEVGYQRGRAQVGDRIDRINLTGLVIEIDEPPLNGASGRYYPDNDVINIAP